MQSPARSKFPVVHQRWEESLLKDEDDGSYQVLNAGLIPLENFVLCGVNTPWCVYRTAYGLWKRQKNAQLHMIDNACNDAYDHEFGVARFVALQQREPGRVHLKRITQQPSWEEYQPKLNPTALDRAKNFREWRGG